LYRAGSGPLVAHSTLKIEYDYVKYFLSSDYKEEWYEVVIFYMEFL
jgi:hypothetical protein